MDTSLDASARLAASDLPYDEWYAELDAAWRSGAISTEDHYRLVEDRLARGDAPARPLAQAAAPAAPAESSLRAGESSLRAGESSLRADESAARIDDSIAPSDDSIAPSDDSIAPSDDSAAPGDDSAGNAGDRAVFAARATEPAEPLDFPPGYYRAGGEEAPPPRVVPQRAAAVAATDDAEAAVGSVAVATAGPRVVPTQTNSGRRSLLGHLRLPGRSR